MDKRNLKCFEEYLIMLQINACYQNENEDAAVCSAISIILKEFRSLFGEDLK